MPRYEFPPNFSLSVNQKHYSNEQESIKLIKEILIPHIESERERLGLQHQEALAIFDVFRGQITQPVLDLLKDNKILFDFVPANMTSIFQPLDLTVNGYAKRYYKKVFNEWYTDQVFQQLDDGKDLEEIDVKLQLTTLKPLHAQWLTEFYNHMTTNEGKKVILNGWKASGIREAIDEGYDTLHELDPFQDIDPLMSTGQPAHSSNITAYLEMSEEDRQLHGYRPCESDDNDDDDDDDEVFEPERNYLDAFN